MLTALLPAVSNKATWREDVEIRDEDDNLVNLVTDVDEITLSLRDIETGETVITKTVSGGGISTGGSLGTGVFQFLIPASEMANLLPKTYELGVLVEFDDAATGDTEQLILGRVPVLKGL